MVNCYIIIVSYNSSNYIIKCLDSIFSQKNKNFNIILVDNNSSDNTIELVKNNYENELNNNSLSLILNSRNLGYAQGVNTGIQSVISLPDCDCFWVLNSDTYVTDNSLDKLFEYSNNDNIVSPGIYDYYDNDCIQSLGCSINKYFLTTENLLNHDKEINYLSGSSLFFNKSIITKIGLFSVKYFMYYEDVEWCTRAIKNNIKLKIVDKCYVFHKSNISISMKLKIKSQMNRLHYALDHFFYKFPIVLIGVILSILSTIIKRIFFIGNEQHN